MNQSVTTLEDKINQNNALLTAICDAVLKECDKLNLDTIDSALKIDGQEASYHLERDPASGSDSLIGIWKDQQGQKIGMLALHADSSFYAEYDVLLPHPEKKGNFIEAITAWGRGDIIKSEARLIEMPAE